MTRLFAALTFVCLLATAMALTRTSAAARAQPNSQSDPKAAAFRTGGLRAAAAISGSYTRAITTRDVDEPKSLPDLAKFSVAIVVGQPDWNVSRITPDGMSAVMLYRVRVESVLKGDDIPDSITVIIPGGRVGFEDGSWAEVETPGFLRPTPGHGYVWFLEAAPRMFGMLKAIPEEVALPRFVPAHGPLGIYDIGRQGVVMPNGLYHTKFAKDILSLRMTPDAFLERIRATLQ